MTRTTDAQACNTACHTRLTQPCVSRRRTSEPCTSRGRDVLVHARLVDAGDEGGARRRALRRSLCKVALQCAARVSRHATSVAERGARSRLSRAARAGSLQAQRRAGARAAGRDCSTRNPALPRAACPARLLSERLPTHLVHAGRLAAVNGGRGAVQRVLWRLRVSPRNSGCGSAVHRTASAPASAAAARQTRARSAARSAPAHVRRLASAAADQRMETARRTVLPPWSAMRAAAATERRPAACCAGDDGGGAQRRLAGPGAAPLHMLSALLNRLLSPRLAARRDTPSASPAAAMSPPQGLPAGANGQVPWGYCLVPESDAALQARCARARLAAAVSLPRGAAGPRGPPGRFFRASFALAHQPRSARSTSRRR